MRWISVLFFILFSTSMGITAAAPIDTAPAVKSYAPDFELQDLSGKKVRLSDYRGNVVLLNFWSALCAPCRGELPSINRLAAGLGSSAFTVLAVSIDASDKTVRDFVRKENITLTVLRDGDKEVFFDLFAGPVLPASYLLDGRGIIVEISAAPRKWDAPDQRERILMLLKDNAGNNL